jgi:signal transduction histidine kinase
MKRMPLVWRVFLSTSLVATGLFALLGWLAQTHLLRTTRAMLDEELRASFNAYQGSWQARARYLASLSVAVSRLPDVRAAFGTGDSATIRDTAAELWSQVSPEKSVLVVTSPDGRVIASLGGSEAAVPKIDAVAKASARFPEQGVGFSFIGDRLHQIVVTPVYVDAGRAPALINVLVAGFALDAASAAELKHAAGGSDLVITADGRHIAATVDEKNLAEGDWASLTTPLTDVTGRPIGELRFLRPLGNISQRLQTLRWQIAAIWACAILLALLLTFVAARRLLEPVRQLDAAAREVAQGNYAYRVPPGGEDEMSRLGRAFNAMCASIEESRAELIRQERINTLGRIAGAVVHDLRNPLAAIYSGAEMLVDGDNLPPSHTQRIASNIYRASRQVLATLDDLMGLARGSPPAREVCRLREVVEDAWAGIAARAESCSVRFELAGDMAVEVSVARTRVERVFANLFANAVEAMRNGGVVRVKLEGNGDRVTALVCDTGPGVPASIRASLFQPFATAGKSGGLGLGLALSRQTLLDHGGNITLEPSERGACFLVTLPAAFRASAEVREKVHSANRLVGQCGCESLGGQG